MSGEGKPRGEASLLARLLVRVVQLATRSCWLTIAIGALAIGGGLYLSSTRLAYHTSRAALLNEREDYHRRWLKYVAEFGAEEDAIVVVEGKKRDAILAPLDAVVREVSAQPEYFRAVLHEIDLTKLRDKGLFYLSVEELRTIEGFLGDVEPIVRGGWEWLSPGAMATGMCARLREAQPDQLQHAMASAQVKLAQIAESLLSALSDRRVYKSPWPQLSGSTAPLMGLTSQRLIIGGDRIGLVLLKLAPDKGKGFVQNAEAIGRLRDLVERVKLHYPHVSIGLTGLPIMEHDEMQRSQSSMTTATVFSFLGVLAVLVAGFGGLRHSLLAMLALLCGLLWSLAYTTLVVGHLNILSSAFGAVLTGLGINYSIYFVARYLQLRKAHHTVDEALQGTAASVGPGITVSALSSAIAFFGAGLTEFTGVAELGLIAGGGILLCLVAAMTVLPATLRLIDGRRPDRTVPTPLDFHLWINPFISRPRLILITSLAATAAVVCGTVRLRYDYNLLHLEPDGLESVELEQKLVSEARESAYFALSLVKTPEEAAVQKARFAQLPTVERVDEIATRFPTSLEEKRPIIERIRNRLAGLPDRPPQIPVASPAELGQMLSTIQPLMSANLQMAHFQRQLQEIRSLLGQLPASEYYARLSEYQQRVAGDLLGRLHLLRSVANPEPPQLTDLPVGLVSRFVGRHGSHLLRIYVKGDFWDIDNMRQFVDQVRSVDPNVTGNPIQIYEASQQMRRSYEHAAVYALLAILPVVFLNFGTLGATLLAAVPLLLGMLQMFGLMGLLDIPLNAANMIGLSLMLGMGMETGVLILQDYLGQRGPYRMSAATGTAVVLNTLTTMVGFGVLMIADHRGLQSLGRVLTIGMTCSLVSSLVILPALLAWITRRRKKESALESLARLSRKGVDPPMPNEWHPHAAAAPQPSHAPGPIVPRRSGGPRIRVSGD
jgi:hopanoid biosynthesis associated RND transporter like protein HpnN